MSKLYTHLQKLAQDEVERVMKRLPRQVRDSAQAVPIRFEPFPDEESGLDVDLLGVFLGNPLAEMEGPYASPEPTEVVLFLENLWDYAEEDEAIFVEEVRLTLLHELGHFLGLNEEDLDERGLA